jgi:hypothetical protein
MKTFSEEELIAHHLGELSWWKEKLLRRRLAVDVKFAADSEEIAATLRVFSSDPTPEVSEALLQRSWHRVRGSLGVLDSPPRSWRPWMWAAVSTIAVIAIAAIVAIPRIDTVKPSIETAENGVPQARTWSQRLLGELRRNKPDAEPYNHRPGPLTTAPVDAVAEDPALATHLDTAERVLTEVSHTDGPLQPETREQVHRLLLENAVYHQSAEQHGDMETAAVIDDLGRLLTSLDAEPLNVEREQSANPGAIRLEVNLGGVLLDLRILHHNESPNTDQ